MTDPHNPLTQAVAAYRALPPNVSFVAAIKALTGFDVEAMHPGDPRDVRLQEDVVAAATHCMREAAVNPVRSRRVNEVGNLLEPRLKSSFEALGIRAEWPPGGRTGYPDLLVTDRDGRPTYIEVKATAPNSEGSSFRSFYLSPSKTSKIRHNARHLLVAFTHEHTRVGNQDFYRAKSVKILDLALVLGKVKFEYQSSNRAMYCGEAVLASIAL